MKGYVDTSVVGSAPLTLFQFERHGYFCVDYDSNDDKVNHVQQYHLLYLSLSLVGF